ncbi:hypothetical protein Hanom_Chr09g00791681 [Helianthus anomalus]
MKKKKKKKKKLTENEWSTLVHTDLKFHVVLLGSLPYRYVVAGSNLHNLRNVGN